MFFLFRQASWYKTQILLVLQLLEVTRSQPGGLPHLPEPGEPVLSTIKIFGNIVKRAVNSKIIKQSFQNFLVS